MKIFLLVLTVLVGISAKAQTQADFLKSYAEYAFNQYQRSAIAALNLQTQVSAFILKPSEKTLSTARSTYIEARKAYLMTEVLRFAGGPIDRQGGPEALINSWPLDEAQVDYVVGNAKAGIINDPVQYPVINANLLKDLNQKMGETNVTTGFHVIEFLLWGQDLSEDGPGNRPLTDFVPGKGPNAERRSQYLQAVSDLLLQDLTGLVDAWNPGMSNSYFHFVTDAKNEKEQFAVITQAISKFVGEELAQERLFVALDTQEQEEEQSCFSDLTHLDFQYDMAGVERLMRPLLATIRVSSNQKADQLQSSLAEAQAMVQRIPRPFDQAIQDENSRKILMKLVGRLELLADEIRTATEGL